MISEKDTTMGQFLTRNKVVMEDDMYMHNSEQYDEFLNARPWRKE